MAQPALSRLIKTIEQEIGLQLFRRVPRGVELTDAGRSLLDGARATFANLDRALEAARRSARDNVRLAQVTDAPSAAAVLAASPAIAPAPTTSTRRPSSAPSSLVRSWYAALTSERPAEPIPVSV